MLNHVSELALCFTGVQDETEKEEEGNAREGYGEKDNKCGRRRCRKNITGRERIFSS